MNVRPVKISKLLSITSLDRENAHRPGGKNGNRQAEPPNLAPQKDFRVSADNLIVLVQYNFYRACTSNINTLDIQKYFLRLCADIISQPNSNLPPNLQPTFLQQTIKHSSWIDCLPYPKVRDNCIRHQRKFDCDDLFLEVFGELYTSTALPVQEEDDGFAGERGGIIAWGEPWDLNSWEITPKQWKKFGFLYDGCEEVIISTNKRRTERGDDLLDVNVNKRWERMERKEPEKVVWNGPVEESLCRGEMSTFIYTLLLRW
jgi:hypothetical protein